MSFVQSTADVRRIEVALSKPRFVDAEMLSVDFLTDPDWVAAVLPPPLRPADRPQMTAMVGRWRSNCVGDYDGGAIYVSAQHEDRLGDYVLAMWMSGDQPLIYGRDLFGEPKKLASSWLHRSGDVMTGRVERHGVTLLDIEVALGPDDGTRRGAGTNFNIKSRPATNGIGLEEDAILTVCEFQTTLRVSRQGAGTVSLVGTVHDPLDEIVVSKVLRGAYIEGDLDASAFSAATIDKDVFLPYAYGRMDDWSALSTERAGAVVMS